MITLHDDLGRRVFAFNPSTDPYEVLFLLAWSHPHRISTCDRECPTRDGGYCLDCHGTAFAALQEARQRQAEATT